MIIPMLFYIIPPTLNEMPIGREVYEVMHEGKAVREAVQALMGREMRPETE